MIECSRARRADAIAIGWTRRSPADRWCGWKGRSSSATPEPRRAPRRPRYSAIGSRAPACRPTRPGRRGRYARALGDHEWRDIDIGADRLDDGRHAFGIDVTRTSVGACSGLTHLSVARRRRRDPRLLRHVASRLVGKSTAKTHAARALSAHSRRFSSPPSPASC
jgi:hypothetical protein